MTSDHTVFVTFRLAVEDDWPPVAAESLPFIQSGDIYEARAAPLFVKNLSVGDKIRLLDIDSEQVWSWEHVEKSENSTVCLLRTVRVEVEPLLHGLHELGCKTAREDQCGVCSVDVPSSVEAAELDRCLETLASHGLIAAFLSWRHNDAYLQR